jgi:MFS-type transporter involved in bile tolerance (Atg22 family)
MTKEQEKFINKTYKQILYLGLIIAIPAVLSGVLGKFIDTKFETTPFATLTLMFVAFIFTWVFLIKVYFKTK